MDTLEAVTARVAVVAIFAAWAAGTFWLVRTVNAWLDRRLQRRLKELGTLMLKASDKVWVCEKGHVDDHHLEHGGVCPGCGGSGIGDHGSEPDPVCVSCEGGGETTNLLCSRCGGTCEQFSLDGLAREYRERLRVNVGLITENTQLKRKIAGLESPDA